MDEIAGLTREEHEQLVDLGWPEEPEPRDLQPDEILPVDESLKYLLVNVRDSR